MFAEEGIGGGCGGSGGGSGGGSSSGGRRGHGEGEKGERERLGRRVGACLSRALQ